MTQLELRELVENYNNTNFPKIKVDSPLAHSQFRLTLKLSDELTLISWVKTTDTASLKEHVTLV